MNYLLLYCLEENEMRKYLRCFKLNIWSLENNKKFMLL